MDSLLPRPDSPLSRRFHVPAGRDPGAELRALEAGRRAIAVMREEWRLNALCCGEARAPRATPEGCLCDVARHGVILLGTSRQRRSHHTVCLLSNCRWTRSDPGSGSGTGSPRLCASRGFRHMDRNRPSAAPRGVCGGVLRRRDRRQWWRILRGRS